MLARFLKSIYLFSHFIFILVFYAVAQMACYTLHLMLRGLFKSINLNMSNNNSDACKKMNNKAVTMTKDFLAGMHYTNRPLDVMLV